ncbi:hypothetical protein Vafri_10020 [Volvox africanus]|uniref:RNase H type-1 domain-containing protein n=1 Tax=Volvox africanus TaxID=51714 RepID=A0A8J4B9X3_9CHLO|nr:hypothetical protein Vafri_10020 [Volvox africanus]
MKAIYKVIESINHDGIIDGQRVLLHTDSEVTFATLTKWGSMVPNTQDVCVDLFWYCLRHKIALLATWIPREMNTLADSLSKRNYACDWKLCPDVFQHLNTVWGPFMLDLFATDENFQLEPYYTFHYTTRTHGVNAFTHHWQSRAWCNPPFRIICSDSLRSSGCVSMIPWHRMPLIRLVTSGSVTVAG